MIRALILLVVAACAYSAEQQKHEESKVVAGGHSEGEQEPGEESKYRPPSYAGEPLQDRLESQKKVGGRKWGHDAWLGAEQGSDEHLEVKANVGPKGLFSWLGFAAAAVGLLGVAGAVAWKLKPPWLGWLFKLFGRSPAPDSTAAR
jgi:hypothetical protein